MAEIGEIRRTTVHRENGWFIVERIDSNGAPWGHCFLGEWDGREWWLETCVVIDQRDVPDEIWATLAKWRLIDG